MKGITAFYLGIKHGIEMRRIIRRADRLLHAKRDPVAASRLEVIERRILMLSYALVVIVGVTILNCVLAADTSHRPGIKAPVNVVQITGK